MMDSVAVEAGGPGGVSSANGGCGNGGLGVTLPADYRNPSLTLYGGPSGPAHWFAGGGGGSRGAYSNPNPTVSNQGGKGGVGGTNNATNAGPFAGGGNGCISGSNPVAKNGAVTSGGGGGAGNNGDQILQEQVVQDLLLFHTQHKELCHT